MTTVRPTDSANREPARPKPAAGPAPMARASAFDADKLVGSSAKPLADVLNGDTKKHGWFYTMLFGNEENKLFQIKANLLHFKDIVVGLWGALQAGPLAPFFSLFDKLGAGITAGLARLQTRALATEANALTKTLAWFGRAAGPIRTVATVGLKWLERSAPLFGWLVAVQDLMKAMRVQDNEKVGGVKKTLAWTTFALSVIGSVASTAAAWGAVGALVTAATGLAAPALGAIAISCFALSLLTGWLATRGTPTPAQTARALKRKPVQPSQPLVPGAAKTA